MGAQASGHGSDQRLQPEPMLEACSQQIPERRSIRRASLSSTTSPDAAVSSRLVSSRNCSSGAVATFTWAPLSSMTSVLSAKRVANAAVSVCCTKKQAALRSSRRLLHESLST